MLIPHVHGLRMPLGPSRDPFSLSITTIPDAPSIDLKDALALRKAGRIVDLGNALLSTALSQHDPSGGEVCQNIATWLWWIQGIMIHHGDGGGVAFFILFPCFTRLSPTLVQLRHKPTGLGKLGINAQPAPGSAMT